MSVWDVITLDPTYGIVALLVIAAAVVLAVVGLGARTDGRR